MSEKRFPSISGSMMYNGKIIEKSEITQSGRTTSEEANLGKEGYYTDGYFSPAQFISFAEQIRLVHSLKRKNLLEIGIGNALVSDFLRKAGFNVTTFDINPNLNPNVVGSVTDLVQTLQQRKFDLVLCAEVLEHMPFEYFEQAIENIAATTNEYAILTLPRSQKVIFDIQFNIKIPKLPYMVKGLFWAIPNSNINSEHHWELDSNKKTKTKNIKSILEKYFTVINFNRFRFRPVHHYFVLKKHCERNSK